MSRLNFRHNSSVRAQVLSVLAACVFAGAAAAGQMRPAATPERNGVKRITWADTAPLRGPLESQGLTATTFASHIDRLRAAHDTRVRLGDLDHLVFYLLQSNGFTPLPPIEPALSAKALVDGMGAAEREAFLQSGDADVSRVSAAVRARATALLTALAKPQADPRLVYFGELVKATFPDTKTRASALTREYLRVMRFVYEKEFVAQRSARPADAVADLYRTRGLSTDTAVEAGFLVSFGVGILKALDPDRRIRRVLIVGPGLDLAPRTGFLEAGPPESYQPWAVMDALVSHGLARFGDLEVVGADINPRVVVAPAARARHAARAQPHDRDSRQRDRDPVAGVPGVFCRPGPRPSPPQMRRLPPKRPSRGTCAEPCASARPPPAPLKPRASTS